MVSPLRILLRTAFCQGGEEGSAPSTDGKERAEEDDGVYAGASGTHEVNVLEVEPEGELVEGERRSDSIKQRHEAAGENRRRIAAGTKFTEPAITDGQQKQNSRHQVMNVAA